MFNVNNSKLTEVAEVKENLFLTSISFQELKDLVNLGIIKVNLTQEVPYVPLENEATIMLTIDESLLDYNRDTYELNIKGKFSVADGNIRLITFMNSDNEENNLDDRVILNISCYNTGKFQEIFNNTTL